MDQKPDAEQIANTVIEIVKEICGSSGVEITRKTNLLSELDIDSLTIVRIDVMIQVRLGLALSADDLEKVVTIDDLVQTLITNGQPVDKNDML